MNEKEIVARLFEMRDEGYTALQIKLIPTARPDSFIGVRTPALRAFARELYKNEEGEAFLRALPHRYFDENQLHAFLLSEEKDFEKCADGVEVFLPYVDNWATCDQLSPKAFKKHREELLLYIKRWLNDSHPYTVRFALGMLMEHYLDEAFDPAYPALVAAVRSEEYYVNMMIAWYFATALAKQYDAVFPYIVEKRLPAWVHNKSIQKALESRRVSPERKETLKQYRISIKQNAE
ncbi:MAG: DNA alkylation repair protein [Clostridia bacterium]|nr:DNA alkylation repair protein [Clostridia bacterium]